MQEGRERVVRGNECNEACPSCRGFHPFRHRKLPTRPRVKYPAGQRLVRQGA